MFGIFLWKDRKQQEATRTVEVDHDSKSRAILTGSPTVLTPRRGKAKDSFGNALLTAIFLWMATSNWQT
jgi:hypothetical protein